MSEAKHTPTPWGWYAEDSSMVILCGHNQSGDLDPMEQHVASITPCEACRSGNPKEPWTWGRCTTPTEANAEFIVRAANAHDALLKALKAALPFIDDAADAHSVMSCSCLTDECRVVVAMVRDALRQAESS
jgi:hypothetical protein